MICNMHQDLPYSPEKSFLQQSVQTSGNLTVLVHGLDVVASDCFQGHNRIQNYDTGELPFSTTSKFQWPRNSQTDEQEETPSATGFPECLRSYNTWPQCYNLPRTPSDPCWILNLMQHAQRLLKQSATLAQGPGWSDWPSRSYRGCDDMIGALENRNEVLLFTLAKMDGSWGLRELA
ncbi:hypothetical protein ACMFMF_003389 [Clarireedia jacksonii]